MLIFVRTFFYCWTFLQVGICSSRTFFMAPDGKRFATDLQDTAQTKIQRRIPATRTTAGSSWTCSGSSRSTRCAKTWRARLRSPAWSRGTAWRASNPGNGFWCRSGRRWPDREQFEVRRHSEDLKSNWHWLFLIAEEFLVGRSYEWSSCTATWIDVLTMGSLDDWREVNSSSSNHLFPSIGLWITW